MKKKQPSKIAVQIFLNAPVEKVWKFWTSPGHIVKWNSASPDWHTSRAENDLRNGGKFISRMEARDGSMGFDFEGIYNNVQAEKIIEYTLADERNVSVEFSIKDSGTMLVETFDPETENSMDLQKAGWQAILDNFKKYVERN